MTGEEGRSRQIALALKGLPRGPRECTKSLLALSQLRALGWQRSSAARRSLDANGSPLPWLTYSALEWLSGRMSRIATVLEFGAGGSTLWFARMGAEVTSLEHSRWWIRELSAKNVESSVRVVPVTQDEPGYLQGLERVENKAFDLVLIDGPYRAACARACFDYVGDSSLICLDDSQRPEYEQVITHFHDAGFCSLGFVGFAPIVAERKETRFFSRRLNDWLDGSV